MARAFRPASILLVLAVAVWTASSAAAIQYREWTVGTLVMAIRASDSDQAQLYLLGPVNDSGVFQAAMRISEAPGREDPGTKNAVLFECGMHAREWYAAESCYWLIDFLLENAATPLVRELLDHADVWVIPQSNPAGRFVDDLVFGDPTRYAYVCDEGTPARIGRACATDSDCGTPGRCYTDGWRANANRASCNLGVDPARNFSSGWNEAAPLCENEMRCGEGGVYCSTNPDSCTAPLTCEGTRMKYRGDAPFSELETLNLRRFVHNHMISMVAISHTQSEQITNRWYDAHRASAYVTDQLDLLNQTGAADFVAAFGAPGDPSLDLRHNLGRGHGQFSAWLTSPSDASVTPGTTELDFGTERNISTFYFELPVHGDHYYNAPYRQSFGDGSNSYHPSGNAVRDLWEASIQDLMLSLIRQARSPQCPVNSSGEFEVLECESEDFGLVGAKIANSNDEAGLLDFDASSREETLPSGTHRVVFAVQNFSRPPVPPNLPPRDTTATVVITREGIEEATYPVSVSLDPGARGIYSVEHTFPLVIHPVDYRVEIELATDDFGDNNRKSFAFRVGGELVARARRYLAPRARLQLGTARLVHRAAFELDGALHPEKAGVEVSLHGHVPNVPHVQNGQAGPISRVYGLPAGSPWWDHSNPEKGYWTYRDPKGLAGPVRSLTLLQHVAGKAQKRRTEVDLDVSARDLGAFDTARTIIVDVELRADRLVLSSLSPRRTRLELPPRKLPAGDDEIENEPGDPFPQQNAQ